MLLSVMIDKLRLEFPLLKFSIDDANSRISIPAKNEDVGSIEIQDELDELNVFVGKFTHWHVGCYADGLTEKQKAEEIAENVADFLHSLFNDQIVMWGSHLKGGGFYHRSEASNSKPWYRKSRKEWVWSGELHS
jgi:hypothetical protein